MPERLVVLLNLGTPRAPTPAAVREFLSEFLSDSMVVDWPRWLWSPILRRVILPKRAIRGARSYASIWSAAGSPLDAGSRKMVTALGAHLGAGTAVELAYRYGAPRLAEVLDRAAAARIERIVLVPLFPQRTSSTTGGMIAHARECARRSGVADRLALAIPPADAPGYAEALAGRLAEACAGAPHAPEHLVMSFHSIPTRHDRREGGIYRADCAATARALLRAARWPYDRASLAYQSRFGPEPWLRPATSRVLARLPGRGVRRAAVITPGFLTDGVETLEEIGALGRATFVAAGGEEFTRAPAVEDHPAMIGALADLVAAIP
jgi:ferrochelatase